MDESLGPKLVANLLRIRKTRLAIAVLAFTLACHAVVFLLMRFQLHPARWSFTTEAEFFLLLSSVCSVVVFAVESPRSFRIAHYARFVILFVIFRILFGRRADIELFLLLPFLVETAIYEKTQYALVTSSVALFIVLAGDLINLRDTGMSSLTMHAALIALPSAATIGTFNRLTAYRERIVENEQLLESLNSAFDNLVDTNLGLQLYATHAESESANKERNRITRELHDSIGYALTNVTMMMSAGKMLLKTNPAKLEGMLNDTRALAERCLQETRQTLYRLRTISTPASRGSHAISQLVTAFKAATCITVDFQYGNTPWSFGETLDAVLYRLVQEGLTNSFRHGKATRIRIVCWSHEGELRITIWDNGTGSSSSDEGLGLRGMRERVEALGGSIDHHNTVDGYELSAVIPLGGEGAEEAHE